LQDIKEKPKKESSVDQQTEENEDKPNDSTELDKGREKITQDELQAIEREKVCIPFIYLPILEREKVCISLFIFQF
jgi:hypothetical protein